MQTFLPYANFEESAKVLDKKRLWKQVVEAHQILNILAKKSMGQKVGYGNHPAVLQWENYEDALALYYNTCWYHAVNVHKVKVSKLQPVINKDGLGFMGIGTLVLLPKWLGYEPYHSNHRARLLDKDFAFYSQYGWSETPSKDNYWPSKHFK